MRSRRATVAMRTLFVQMKSRPCADCGGLFPYYVMEFDHVRGEKLACIGSMKFHKVERILAEAAKCDLVCSNCHAIRTHTRREYRRRLKAEERGKAQLSLLKAGGSAP